ncbi:MAG: hypothetical protein ACHREM_14680 [Polyangiales bacterium]
MKMVEREEPAVISFNTMRVLIGVIALLLPVLTTVGYRLTGGPQGVWLGSISEYYYSTMRDVFVGGLSMIALFLVAYRGYNNLEDRLFNCAAALAVAIAWFPMSPDLRSDAVRPLTSCSYDVTSPSPCFDSGSFDLQFGHRAMLVHFDAFRRIHEISAGLMFVFLGVVSLFFFTKSKDPKDRLTSPKRKRNLIFRVCGVIIWGSLALHTLTLLPLLLTEWICLWAFGVSWLVKGASPWEARPSTQR